LKDVLFAIPPEIVLLDVAGPADAFRMANQERPQSYRLRFAGPSRSPRTGIGLHLGSLQPLPKKLEGESIVVVPGITTEAFDLDSPAIDALVGWLARVGQDERVTIMCVCAGSVIAAKAGLLSGRECTTHHRHIDDLLRVDPSARVHRDRLFVEDGRVYTSAGVTSGIDLTLYLIGQHLGAKCAAAVARDLVVYMRRSGNDPQLSAWVLHRNHIHPLVHKVQDAVMRNPAAPWSSERLAAVACTSPRHLARLFAEHAGCSPLEYVQRLRVALARELIANSDLALERVAERSGFSSAHHLRRVWRRWETSSPARIRRSLQA
jgi:transcriptional regulator GlxA family with amidase domain